MKFITFLLCIIVVFGFGCQNQENENTLIDDPKQFAKWMFENKNVGNDNKNRTKLFEKYGYNLTTGTQKYIEISNAIHSDPEKYKLFNEEYTRLLHEQAFGKEKK